MLAIRQFAVFVLFCYINVASGQTARCYGYYYGRLTAWGPRATAEAALTAAWQGYISTDQSFVWGPLEIGGPDIYDRWLLSRLSRTTPPFISGPSVADGTYLAYPTTRYIEIWDSRIPGPAGERMEAGYNVLCYGAPTVVLTGPNETHPAGTSGTSEITLTAKVTDGTTQKPGVALSFSVDVTANSGGHDHDDASRPKGNLSPTQGTTDANGEVKLTFTAPQVAGIHTIKATCSSCSNSPASKEIQVKVPELLAIFALPFRDAQWAYPGIGQVPGRHSDNHYLTVAAVTRLLGITQKFNSIWPDAPRLTLNDASLAWGGKFDIPATWEKNPKVHAEHRMGDNIDVRANAAPGAVPANIRKVVFRWLRDESLAEDDIPPEFVIENVNALRESIGSQNEHFHLRLGN